MARDFEQIYNTFGIKPAMLDDNYSPEVFGRELIRDFVINDEVSYSSSTNYTNENTKQKHMVEKQRVVYV